MVMKVDVILITYNQEQYINQAIESILMQCVNDDIQVRVIIADDCSMDNTLDIIHSYEKESPFPFVYLEKQNNMGHVRNYQRAFSKCNGDYVAILEGDDWWSSPLHIQKHVSFLYEHRECVLTTQYPIWYNEEEKQFIPFAKIQNNANYEYITLAEEIRENKIVNLSSCVICCHAIKRLDRQIFDCLVFDWPMYINLAQLGLLCVLSGTSNVYRYKSSGLYAGLDEKEQQKKDVLLLQEIEKIFPKYSNYYDAARRVIKYKEKSNRRKILELLLKPFVYVEKYFNKVKKIYREIC